VGLFCPFQAWLPQAHNLSGGGLKLHHRVFAEGDGVRGVRRSEVGDLKAVFEVVGDEAGGDLILRFFACRSASYRESAPPGIDKVTVFKKNYAGPFGPAIQQRAQPLEYFPLLVAVQLAFAMTSRQKQA
jgi:hypothetical protein